MRRLLTSFKQLVIVGLFICIVFSFINSNALGAEISTALHAQTMVLTTPAGPPLSLENQQGFIDRVVAEALARNGYQLTVSHLPAERALINANNGIDDGALNRIGGLSKVYPNLVQVPEKTFSMEFAAFTRNADFHPTDWNSLKPYTIGIITGWKILERNVPPEAQLTKVKNAEQLFTLLQNGRADVILYGKWQGLDYIHKQQLTGIKLLQPSLAKMDMFVYFHKKHQSLVDKFSQSLVDMKSDGAYQRIYDEILAPLAQ